MADAFKVLVVDDDPDDRQLLAEDLRELGCETIFAVDGTSAMSMARNERPDASWPR